MPYSLITDTDAPYKAAEQKQVCEICQTFDF